MPGYLKGVLFVELLVLPYRSGDRAMVLMYPTGTLRVERGIMDTRFEHWAEVPLYSREPSRVLAVGGHPGFEQMIPAQSVFEAIISPASPQFLRTGTASAAIAAR